MSIESLTAAVVDLQHQLDGAITKIRELKTVAPAISDARQSVDALDKAMQRSLTGVLTLGQGVSELVGKFGLSTDLPGFVQPGRSTDSNEQAAAYRTSVTSQFEDLSRRIKTATGDPNNFFAHEIDLTIGYLRDNRLTPAEAIARLQQVLWNWQGGLFQEMSDPNISMAMRQLAAELERFIVSGMI